MSWRGWKVKRLKMFWVKLEFAEVAIDLIDRPSSLTRPHKQWILTLVTWLKRAKWKLLVVTKKPAWRIAILVDAQFSSKQSRPFRCLLRQQPTLRQVKRPFLLKHRPYVACSMYYEEPKVLSWPLFLPCLKACTVRKIFRNEEPLSTSEMRLPQKQAPQDDFPITPHNLYAGWALSKPLVWIRIILIRSYGFGRPQSIGCGMSLKSSWRAQFCGTFTFKADITWSFRNKNTAWCLKKTELNPKTSRIGTYWSKQLF